MILLDPGTGRRRGRLASTGGWLSVDRPVAYRSGGLLRLRESGQRGRLVRVRLRIKGRRYGVLKQ